MLFIGCSTHGAIPRRAALRSGAVNAVRDVNSARLSPSRNNGAVSLKPPGARRVRQDEQTQYNDTSQVRQWWACGPHVIDFAQALQRLVGPFAERQRIDETARLVLLRLPGHLGLAAIVDRKP